MTTDAQMPERIWIAPTHESKDPDDYYLLHPMFRGGRGTEYLRRDLCASGQVRAMVERILSTKSRVRGGASGQTIEAAKRSTFYEISEWDLDELLDLAALTPAPLADKEAHRNIPAEPNRPEETPFDRGYVWGYRHGLRDAATPTAQEAVAVGWEPIHNWRPSDRGDHIRQEADGTWSRKVHPPQPSVSVAEAPSKAAQDVLAERQRQISVEGWTPEHDDEHIGSEMAEAALCYIDHAIDMAQPGTSILSTRWPWKVRWWKPTTPRRDLVKAGALILAEIERLDRAALKGGA